MKRATIIGIILLLFLVGVIIYVIYNYKSNAEKCQKLGEGIFTAPNGSCYQCPENTQVILKDMADLETELNNENYGDEEKILVGNNDYDEQNTWDDDYQYRFNFELNNNSQSNQLTLNQRGVPLCRQIKTSAMTSLRKTVAPALEAASGYRKAEDLGSVFSKALNVSKYTLPAVKTTKTKGVKSNVGGFNIGYTTYRCPKGYKLDTNVSKDSDKACYRQCSVGVTPDANGSCIVCPKGYLRTGAPADSDKACKKPCQGTESNGKCYKCPAGFIRSGKPMEGDSACIVTCPEGSFRVKGKCYQCPVGYQKNPAAISDQDICYKKCSAGEYEDQGLQTCFVCPEGYSRVQNMAPVNTGACVQDTQQPATLIAATDKNGNMLSPLKTRTMVERVKQSLSNLI